MDCHFRTHDIAENYSDKHFVVPTGNQICKSVEESRIPEHEHISYSHLTFLKDSKNIYIREERQHLPKIYDAWKNGCLQVEE